MDRGSELDLFDLSHAVLSQLKPNFDIQAQKGRIGRKGVQPLSDVWLLDVKNVCTDFCPDHTLFDMTYAVLSQLKPNVVFL